MADDILSRLRASVCWYNFQGTCFACEAADEIERLRAAVSTVDGLHEPLRDEEWLVIRCTQCDVEWPCPTHRALHPKENNDE